MIINRESPVPQYFQLQTWLIEQIEQGVFKPNDRIPTEEEFVKITGLARATIRQAIQNLVNLGYLHRKRRFGTYVLNNSISADKKTMVGLLVPDIRRGYTPELARGVEDEAANNKLSLILCDTDDLFLKANFHSDRLIENEISGVIYVPTAASDEKNRLIIQKFLNKKIPVVLADRFVPGIEVDFVTTDNFEGACGITEYLIQKGHRKIGIILSTLFSTERLRYEGYRKALSDHGLESDESLFILDDGPFIESRYVKYVQRLLKKRKNITAVFCGHDRIAFLIYAQAQRMDLSIPEDLSVVGYDDLNYSTLPLTTMHQPIYEMGKESMKLIMSRIHGGMIEPSHIILKSHLVERSSVLSV